LPSWYFGILLASDEMNDPIEGDVMPEMKVGDGLVDGGALVDARVKI